MKRIKTNQNKLKVNAVRAAAVALSIGAGYAALRGFLDDSVCFDEQWRTFYWNRHWLAQEWAKSGGAMRLTTLFFSQFCSTVNGAAWLCALATTALSLALAAIVGRLMQRIGRKPHFVTCYAIFWLAGIGTLFATESATCNQGTEHSFKAMMCQIGRNDWHAVIDGIGHETPDNYLLLNCLNLAYAETGQLPERFLQQPLRDVESLFVMEIPSPYIAAMLSDIYWSIGEISMAQRYAFEANEKLGDLSPRLLKRLVHTNIVYGHYAVAEKYLRWLESSPAHRSWAERHRRLLDDAAVEADTLLGQKRRCIPAQNCFPSTRSLPYDLQIILSQMPDHRPSAQYLQAIQMLKKQ